MRRADERAVGSSARSLVQPTSRTSNRSARRRGRMATGTSMQSASAADWVGVVANRNSGMGSGLRLVKRLAEAPAAGGLLRPGRLDAGGAGLDGEPIGGRPALPLSRRRRGRRHGFRLAQRATRRPAHGVSGRDRKPGRATLRPAQDPDELARTIADARPVRVDVGLVRDAGSC